MSKLAWAFWKFNSWILVHKRFVKWTEGSILLTDSPLFLVIEKHLNYINSIVPMIMRVFFNFWIPDHNLQLHLEKVTAVKVWIFRAIFWMFEENVSWMEGKAKTTLVRNWMFEALLKYLQLAQFGWKLGIFGVLSGNRFWIYLICLLQIFNLLLRLKQVLVCFCWENLALSYVFLFKCSH